MSFLTTLFGGPSQSEINAANSESSLAGTYSNAFGQTFGEQQGLLQQINQQLTPIANLGPNQQGFSPQELASLNTQAIDTTGAAARNAKQSAGNILAGQGAGSPGGTNSSGLVSGVQQQIEGSIDSQAANELASTQNAITQKNYDVGRKNFWDASAGEQSLASKYNPEAFGSLASSTTQSAFNDQGKVQQQKGTILGDLGKIAGVAGDFFTGGFGNLDTAGTSTAGEQLGNFFQGGIQGLSQ